MMGFLDIWNSTNQFTIASMVFVHSGQLRDEDFHCFIEFVLMTKLPFHEFFTQFIRWILDCLSERSSQVIVDGHDSNPQKVNVDLT